MLKSSSSFFVLGALLLTPSVIGANWNTTSSFGGHSVGAVYFLTNTPGQSSYVVASELGSSGRVSPKSLTSTTGLGGAATVAPALPLTPHPDALSSQDALVVSGSYLFALSPGSNLVSMFSIDEQDPTKITLLSSVSSGGDFPSSLGVNANTTMLCTADSGADDGVVCFRIDSKNGLTPIVGSKRPFNLGQTTPPSGPLNSPSEVKFANNGDLLVAVKGASPTSPPGYILSYAVENGNISTSPLKVVPVGGAFPFGSAVAASSFASGGVVVTTDPFVGVVTYDLGVSPPRSVATVVPGNNATCWIAYSEKTQSYYTTDVNNPQLVEVTVDATTLAGTIVKTYALPSSGNIDMVVTPTKKGDFLHVLGAGSQSITTYSLTTRGNAKEIYKVDIAPVLANKAGFTLKSSMQGLAAYIKA